MDKDTPTGNNSNNSNKTATKQPNKFSTNPNIISMGITLSDDNKILLSDNTKLDLTHNNKVTDERDFQIFTHVIHDKIENIFWIEEPDKNSNEFIDNLNKNIYSLWYEFDIEKRSLYLYCAVGDLQYITYKSIDISYISDYIPPKKSKDFNSVVTFLNSIIIKGSFAFFVVCEDIKSERTSNNGNKENINIIDTTNTTNKEIIKAGSGVGVEGVGVGGCSTSTASSFSNNNIISLNIKDNNNYNNSNKSPNSNNTKNDQSNPSNPINPSTTSSTSTSKNNSPNYKSKLTPNSTSINFKLNTEQNTRKIKHIKLTLQIQDNNDIYLEEIMLTKISENETNKKLETFVKEAISSKKYDIIAETHNLIEKKQ